MLTLTYLCWAMSFVVSSCRTHHQRQPDLRLQMKEKVLEKLMLSLQMHDFRTSDDRQQQQQLQQQRPTVRHHVRDYENDMSCDQLSLIGDIHSVKENLHSQCGMSEFKSNVKLFPTQRWRFVPFNKQTPSLTMPGRITNATLMLHKKWLNHVEEVALVYCSQSADGGKVGHRVSVFKDYPSSVTNRWHVYDVGAVFGTDRSLGLNGGAFSLAYRHCRSVAPRGTSAQFKPHLHITLCQQHSNKLREVDMCPENHDQMQQPACCLQPVEVDFEREGLHFVHSPKKLTLHTCRGLCPIQYLTDERDKKILFERFLNGSRFSVGELCCVPDGYQPVVIQTKTAHSASVIRSLTLRDLDVTSCSCKL